MKKSSLLILPNLLGSHRYHAPYLPQSVDKAVSEIQGLIAESERGGRLFLSHFEIEMPVAQVPIAILNKKTKEEDFDFLLEPILEGETWGYVSDCGLPCIADPGSALVFRARQRGIPVKAFVGPSSVMLALILSGLPGQRFAFHGYPPKDESSAVAFYKEREEIAKKEKATQIMIEAPHKNKHTLKRLLETLEKETLLAVAWDITMPGQGVVCQTVERWNKMPLPNIQKKPAIFLFY